MYQLYLNSLLYPICIAFTPKHSFEMPTKLNTSVWSQFLPDCQVSQFVFASESCPDNLLLRIQYVEMYSADCILVICLEETTFY